MTVGPDFTPPTADGPGQWAHLPAAPAAPASVADAASATSATSATSAIASAMSPASAAAVAASAASGAVAAPGVRFDPDRPPDPFWWRTFDDPMLNRLIARAVAGNLDLRAALLRIAASRSQEQIARAAGLPNVSANASYMREQLGLKGLLQEQGVDNGVSSLGAPGSPVNQISPGLGNQLSQSGAGLLNNVNSPVSLYQTGFDASWELDLFGRVRRSVEQANAQSQATIEQRNDALVSLEAEVARTYAQLRGAQTARRVARDIVATETQTVALTQSQQSNGLTRQVDVEAAKVQLATSQAQLPQYDQQITQAMNGLALLIGAAPGTLDGELTEPGAIPPVPPTVPIGLPAELVRRRPDVRRAEAQLHAATAEVGVATAQLFPDISLTGSFGYRATKARDIGNWANSFYSFGPAISLPIFQGGQIVANIRMTKAERAAAALDYRKAVLTALSDVDNALVAYQSEHARRQALEESVAASNRSFLLSRDGYSHGIVSFIDVLNAQASLEQNRASLVSSLVAETTDLVAVYKALGGGWEGAKADPLPVGTLGDAGAAPNDEAAVVRHAGAGS